MAKQQVIRGDTGEAQQNQFSILTGPRDRRHGVPCYPKESPQQKHQGAQETEDRVKRSSGHDLYWSFQGKGS